MRSTHAAYAQRYENMDDLSLRKATAEDSEFAYRTKKAAFRKYVEKLWGWDEEEQRIIEDAAAFELPVRLGVLKVNSRAAAFFQRLGFRTISESDTHLLMERLS